MINYLDRTVLGVVAPSLRADLAIDAATMGVVFFAFCWTYAGALIPGGVFLDRFDASALVDGAGGGGSAIAASLAEAGAVKLGLYDVAPASADKLGDRVKTYYPTLAISTGSVDPGGYDIVANATPLGVKAGDPLPIEVERVAPSTFVGEVVMKEQLTPLLRPAIAKGCQVQVGTDMLYELIPACLEFSASARTIRRSFANCPG
jgi:shikimate dehydrogenase